MKAHPIYAKGVSRHSCHKATCKWLRFTTRRQAADHHLIYAFRETMIGLGTTSAALPGGAT